MARATREARGVLGAGSSGGVTRGFAARSPPSPEMSRSVGSTRARGWRRVATEAAEARRADDALEAMQTRSERRDARRRLATWRRAVAARRASTVREARADRFAERRLKERVLAPALRAWIRFARARDRPEGAQRAGADVRSQTPRENRAARDVSGPGDVVGGHEGITTLAADVAAFAARRRLRTLSNATATWRWRAVASTEARQFAADLARRAGVQCVRAWRKHCVDKSAKSSSLRRRYAAVVTRRMARRLRQWRIAAVNAIAARVRSRRRTRSRRSAPSTSAIAGTFLRMAMARGVVQRVRRAVCEADALRNRDTSRAVLCGWRRAGEIARRLAACERRVATRRVRRTALECVRALAIHASRSRRLRFAARCGQSPSAASTMTPSSVIRRAFAEWRGRAASAAADREREARGARGDDASEKGATPAVRPRVAPVARERRARGGGGDEVRRANEGVEVSSVSGVHRVRVSRERRGERARTGADEGDGGEVAGREVLAEAEMIANRTSVEFDPACAEPAEERTRWTESRRRRVSPRYPRRRRRRRRLRPISFFILQSAPAATIESIDESDLRPLRGRTGRLRRRRRRRRQKFDPRRCSKREGKRRLRRRWRRSPRRPRTAGVRGRVQGCVRRRVSRGGGGSRRLSPTRRRDERRFASYRDVARKEYFESQSRFGRQGERGSRERRIPLFAPSGTFAKVYHDAGRIATGGSSDDAAAGPVRGARTAKRSARRMPSWGDARGTTGTDAGPPRGTRDVPSQVTR